MRGQSRRPPKLRHQQPLPDQSHSAPRERAAAAHAPCDARGRGRRGRSQAKRGRGSSRPVPASDRQLLPPLDWPFPSALHLSSKEGWTYHATTTG